MPITKDHIVEVLRDPRLKRLRFTVDTIDVNSDGYETVSDLFEAGAIHLEQTGKSYSEYLSEINTLQLKAADALDIHTRGGIVHECTHIIADINEVKTTRLTDEVAGYLAEFAYLVILDPTQYDKSQELVIGRGAPPMNTLMRTGMQAVKKYKLAESSGRSIDRDDVKNLAKMVRAVPEYSKIGETEKLIADGVKLNSDQARKVMLLGLVRLMNTQMNEAEAAQLSVKIRYTTHENYTTDDNELLGLFDTYKRRGTTQTGALQKLFHIFWHIDQRSATRLAQRLATALKGDVVSQRFQKEFMPQVRAALLTALQASR